MPVRSTHRRRLTTGLLGLLLAVGALLSFTPNASAGIYTVHTDYAGDINATRGWQIEWQVPAVSNPTVAAGAVGQWFDNLESGVYFNGGEWHVYFYGDDNGLDNYDPSCAPAWYDDSKARYIGGWCGAIQPGAHVAFKYEFCNMNHHSNVNGTQRCLYFDLKDGKGWRFMAEDDGRDPSLGREMYAHDVETFEDSGITAPIIPCDQPIKMVAQKIKTTAATWVKLTGASTWTFGDDPGNHYKFQNQHLSATSANWEVCSE